MARMGLAVTPWPTAGVTGNQPGSGISLPAFLDTFLLFRLFLRLISWLNMDGTLIDWGRILGFLLPGSALRRWATTGTSRGCEILPDDWYGDSSERERIIRVF